MGRRSSPPGTYPAAAGEHLRYSSDSDAGIVRRRVGRGFRYWQHDEPVRDPSVLARIRGLAIPPAWRDVWICPDPRGHLQAVGRDARGRKQSRYHTAWRRGRDEMKFSRLAAFGRALPRIRRRVEADLVRPGLSKDKVLATVVRLLETTALRVGNEAYARSNGSFGLTTLRNRHVTLTSGALRFRFRGKGGKVHEVGVRDRRLAGIVARCEALPGQELFQYMDEAGDPRPIESADVNAYLRAAAGIEVTAKDFRTWIGTLVAFDELRRRPGQAAERPRSALARSVGVVAGVLGNTPAVSRQSYVAPVVVEAYLDGSLPQGRRRRVDAAGGGPGAFGRSEELALVRLLEGAASRAGTAS
ncbi:MAG: DNA topoisomerase IB [Chloroflexi bacterium]|nr:DNA topoisomerase IB [Chloroflexota bacterium]